MTIKELIDKLKEYDENLTVGLSVYGHSYDSKGNDMSHGSLKITVGTSYNKDLLFIHAMDLPKYNQK